LGSRVKKLGSHIDRLFFRHVIGRVFATLFRIVFDIKTYDSQCGAKFFTKDLIKKLFAEPFVSSWLFDLEIIIRESEKKMIEYPLKNWQDKKGSKILSFKSMILVLSDLIRLRVNY